MSYGSILVNLDIDRPIAPIVNAAMDLAGRFGARLIGHCSADVPLPMAVGQESGALAADAWQQARNNISGRLKEVRAEFNRLTAGPVETDWREDLTGPTHALVTAARTADLVMMAAWEGASTGDAFRVADPASVILRAGRPVLIVASKAQQVRAKRIVVAWKDTREARRAVADAVPLLAAADEVTVVTVADGVDQWVRNSADDVTAFLAGHDILAEQKLIDSPDDGIALFDFLTHSGADLVVSGAYGHSRLREWAFGGMTRSLLDETGLDRFMSN